MLSPDHQLNRHQLLANPKSPHPRVIPSKMALGQVEFTLLASVLVAYIIFTPEPLVLLRNLSAWAILTWLAWYGYQHWETSPRTRRLVHGIYNDRAISTIIELYWHQALGALGSWGTKSVGITCTRVVVGLASIFGFGWPQSDEMASGTCTIFRESCPGSNPA